MFKISQSRDFLKSSESSMSSPKSHKSSMSYERSERGYERNSFTSICPSYKTCTDRNCKFSHNSQELKRKKCNFDRECNNRNCIYEHSERSMNLSYSACFSILLERMEESMKEKEKTVEEEILSMIDDLNSLKTQSEKTFVDNLPKSKEVLPDISKLLPPTRDYIDPGSRIMRLGEKMLFPYHWAQYCDVYDSLNGTSC